MHSTEFAARLATEAANKWSTRAVRFLVPVYTFPGQRARQEGGGR